MPLVAPVINAFLFKSPKRLRACTAAPGPAVVAWAMASGSKGRSAAHHAPTGCDQKAGEWWAARAHPYTPPLVTCWHLDCMTRAIARWRSTTCLPYHVVRASTRRLHAATSIVTSQRWESTKAQQAWHAGPPAARQQAWHRLVSRESCWAAAGERSRRGQVRSCAGPRGPAGCCSAEGYFVHG